MHHAWILKIGIVKPSSHGIEAFPLVLIISFIVSEFK
jgi:hypothetical protein